MPTPSTRRSLPRSLAALGLSAALSIGAATAPAPALAEYQYGYQVQPQYGLQPQVQDNAAAAAIAALLALGVIAAIQDRDDDDDDDDRRERDRYDDRRERVEVLRRAPDAGRRDDGRVLSAQCVRQVQGGQRVLLGDCLARHGTRASLPGHCQAHVYTQGGYLPVYDMRCLRGSGFHVR